MLLPALGLLTYSSTVWTGVSRGRTGVDFDVRVLSALQSVLRSRVGNAGQLVLVLEKGGDICRYRSRLI